MQASSPADVPPVIATPHHYLVSIYRNELYFVAVLQKEGEVLVSLLYTEYSEHSCHPDVSCKILFCVFCEQFNLSMSLSFYIVWSIYLLTTLEIAQNWL